MPLISFTRQLVNLIKGLNPEEKEKQKMNFRQKSALPLLLADMNTLSKELYPFEHTETDLIDCMLSTYDMFIEDYSKAIKEIREQTSDIQTENIDNETILDLTNEIIEQLDYMEEL